MRVAGGELQPLLNFADSMLMLSCNILTLASNARESSVVCQVTLARLASHYSGSQLTNASGCHSQKLCILITLRNWSSACLHRIFDRDTVAYTRVQ